MPQALILAARHWVFVLTWTKNHAGLAYKASKRGHKSKNLKIFIAILKIWSQCLLFLKRYLENFLCHQAAAVPVLPTNNLSPVFRYITEI